MSLKVYVKIDGWRELVGDIDMKLNFAWDNLSNPTQLISDTSYSIKVPLCPVNNKIFKEIRLLDSNLKSIPYLDPIPTKIVNDLGTVLSDGTSVLNSIDKSNYNLSFTGTLSKIFKGLKNARWGKELTDWLKYRLYSTNNLVLYDNVLTKDIVACSWNLSNPPDFSLDINLRNYNGLDISKDPYRFTLNNAWISTFLGFTNIAQGRYEEFESDKWLTTPLYNWSPDYHTGELANNENRYYSDAYIILPVHKDGEVNIYAKPESETGKVKSAAFTISETLNVYNKWEQTGGAHENMTLNFEPDFGEGLTENQMNEYRSYYQQPYLYIDSLFKMLMTNGPEKDKTDFEEITDGYSLFYDDDIFLDKNGNKQKWVFTLPPVWEKEMKQGHLGNNPETGDIPSTVINRGRFNGTYQHNSALSTIIDVPCLYKDWGFCYNGSLKTLYNWNDGLQIVTQGINVTRGEIVKYKVSGNITLTMNLPSSATFGGHNVTNSRPMWLPNNGICFELKIPGNYMGKRYCIIPNIYYQKQAGGTYFCCDDYLTYDNDNFSADVNSGKTMIMKEAEQLGFEIITQDVWISYGEKTINVPFDLTYDYSPIHSVNDSGSKILNANIFLLNDTCCVGGCGTITSGSANLEGIFIYPSTDLTLQVSEAKVSYTRYLCNRTGKLLTMEGLLGEKTLFDILIAFTKLNNLLWIPYEEYKLVRVCRKDKYLNEVKENRVDITKSLDKETMKISPLSFNENIVVYNFDDIENLKEYQEKYEIGYGSKKIITGNTNGDTEKKLLENINPPCLYSESLYSITRITPGDILGEYKQLRPAPLGKNIGENTSNPISYNFYLRKPNPIDSDWNDGMMRINSYGRTCMQILYDEGRKRSPLRRITDDTEEMLYLNSYCWHGDSCITLNSDYTSSLIRNAWIEDRDIYGCVGMEVVKSPSMLRLCEEFCSVEMTEGRNKEGTYTGMNGINTNSSYISTMNQRCILTDTQNNFSVFFDTPNVTYKNENITGISLYEVNWKNYTEEIYNAKNKKIEANMYLRENEWRKMKKSPFVMLDDRLYYVCEIKGYAGDYSKVTITLRQITDLNKLININPIN